MAHNIFTVPVITSMIGILPWSKKEIRDIDILTRKQMALQGVFMCPVISTVYIKGEK